LNLIQSQQKKIIFKFNPLARRDIEQVEITGRMNSFLYLAAPPLPLLTISSLAGAIHEGTYRNSKICLLCNSRNGFLKGEDR